MDIYIKNDRIITLTGYMGFTNVGDVQQGYFCMIINKGDCQFLRDSDMRPRGVDLLGNVPGCVSRKVREMGPFLT